MKINHYLMSILLMACTSAHAVKLNLDYIGKLSIENKSQKRQNIALEVSNPVGIAVIRELKNAWIDTYYKKDENGVMFWQGNPQIDDHELPITLEPNGVAVLSLPSNSTGFSLGTIRISNNYTGTVLGTLKMSGTSYVWELLVIPAETTINKTKNTPQADIVYGLALKEGELSDLSPRISRKSSSFVVKK